MTRLSLSLATRLAPLIILWLGIGSPSQIVLVFLLAVYP